MLVMNPDDGILSNRKRERVLDNVDSLESYHHNKKLLCDSLLSLRLEEDNSNTTSTPKLHSTEILSDGGSDMDTVDDTPVSSEMPLDANAIESENYLSTLRNGTRKYGRRVDYLIDELIRKSQKTHISSPNLSDIDIEDIIPNSVGPHPLTDRPLGMLWPTVVPTVEGVSMLEQSNNSRNSSKLKKSQSFSSAGTEDRMDDGQSLVDTGSSSSSDDSDIDSNTWQQRNLYINENNHKGKGCNTAGMVTHSDWGIEDVVPIGNPEEKSLNCG